jgi:aldose 1-epimerase
MSSPRSANVAQRPFGQTLSGQPVTQFTLTNAHGLQAEIISYGGIMTRLLVPDRAGRFADIVLGHRSLAEYRAGSAYFGALIGRVGNRIAAGRFTLDGTVHQLATNDAPGGRPCHLHGGAAGFDKVLWQAAPLAGAGLRLRYHSPDGEEGYPGNLDVTVTYRLSDADELIIEYHAISDRPTPVNLTQHNYYNLRGESAGDILDHLLTLHAGRFTPVDAGLIPTGAFAGVAGTPFDFTRPIRIGARIEAADAQLRFGGGYDHNWVIDRTGPGLAHAATVQEPESGRRMEVWTDAPGIQFYAGNAIPAGSAGKTGRPYSARQGFCLETQNHPDAPNHPEFPPAILRPGAEYRTITAYRFSAG